ncbi:hypothetical protein [Pseudomonas trivialis]|uniref:hypothetical protein n=1 Tax=Pseudomonas trivialis TaxID=200450 RepID=UPI000A8DC024
MKKLDLAILRGLLFTYCIENCRDAEREQIIASKNTNNEKKLSELLNTPTKPEFFSYKKMNSSGLLTLFNIFYQSMKTSVRFFICSIPISKMKSVTTGSS